MFKQSVIWFRSAPLQLTAVVEGVTALLPCLTELILMCLNEDLAALQKNYTTLFGCKGRCCASL